MLALIDSAGGSTETSVVQTSYTYSLVVLSMLVAFASSWASFYLAQVNRQALSQNHRRLSLFCGGLVLGLGIWATHFIGMLAVSYTVSVHYRAGITALSITPGIVAAFIALWLFGDAKPLSPKLLISGLVLSTGIVCMHYSGIAAMQLPEQAQLHLNWHLPALAWLAGIGLIAWAFQSQQKAAATDLPRPRQLLQRALASGLTACAIGLIHYVAMHTMHMQTTANTVIPADNWVSEHSDTELSLLIASMAGAIFLIFGLANALLRYRDLWQAVAARDARLQAMIETAPDGVVTINDRGLIQEFNPKAQSIFGYEAEEIIGHNISCLMPLPLSEHHDSYLRKHQGRPDLPIDVNEAEVLGQHKNGKLIPLLLSVGKVNTASDTIFVGYLEDISEKKQKDAQLRIAASVFEHVCEGVAIIDANHNISDTNPAFVNLLETTKAACIGKPFESFYEDIDTPLDTRKLWQTVATQNYWQTDVLYRRADGSAWHQRLSISPVINENKRIHHFIAVISDVSDSVKAQSAKQGASS